MKQKNLKILDSLVLEVNAQVRGIEQVAKKDTYRAYGGITRAGKGALVEYLCKELINIAWNELGGKVDDMIFSKKKIPIPLKKDYLKSIKSPEIRSWIENNLEDFVFYGQVDVQVFIKNIFILGVECKAYSENAMLKRILVDFSLLKTIFPNLQCAILQLESQLTGDYSQIYNKTIFGSHGTHTLLSYFDIDLNIITLLNDERKVEKPIHKPDFLKSLEKKSLVKTVNKFIDILQEHI